MQTKQTGFGIVEVLLISTIILLLGFIGWDVYYTHTRPKPKPVATASSIAPAPSTAPAIPTSVAACTTTDLKLSISDVNGTAGTFYRDAILTNVSNHTCTLNGYPKVVLVSATRQQLGQPADSSGPTHTSPISLQPFATAHAAIGFPDPSVFDSPSACSQTSAYIELTIPGTSAPFESAAAQKYCPGFLVQAFAPGN